MKKIYFICFAFLITYGTSFATTYSVGPGKTYTTISSVPWEALTAGDTVLIHYRATPYKEKFVLGASGTENMPVVVRGVPSAGGALPIIEGIDATTRLQLNFWSENRGIIKIGGTSVPSDNASWIVVENLEVRSARTGYSFTDEAGAIVQYVNNTAAIFIEKGDHITIRNCTVHDCGNGIFSAHQSSNVVIEHCRIYDNGIENSILEHNTYTESLGIIYQFNYFGPLRTNCLGNNLKDRSAGTIIRYNWIESGNRQLDLVESEFSDFNTLPQYRQTFVYNNVLVEPETGGGNSQICHYGGDNGTTSQYRKGTLYFYYNTVISKRTGNTTLFRLSTNDETADVRNNVIYVSAAGTSLGIVDQTGTANLYSNWLKTGWKNSHSGTTANVISVSGNINGTSPGFTDYTNENYSPASGSPLINAAGPLHSSTSNYTPEFTFASSLPTYKDRTQLNDIGAYSVTTTLSLPSSHSNVVNIYPNPFTNLIHLEFTTAENRKLEILDVAGKKIIEYKLTDNKTILEIPSALEPGIYLLTIQEQQTITSKKLIKR